MFSLSPGLFKYTRANHICLLCMGHFPEPAGQATTASLWPLNNWFLLPPHQDNRLVLIHNGAGASTNACVVISQNDPLQSSVQAQYLQAVCSYNFILLIFHHGAWGNNLASFRNDPYYQLHVVFHNRLFRSYHQEQSVSIVLCWFVR